MRPQRWVLMMFFVAGTAGLLLLTLRATSVRSVFDNAALMKDVWFQVTLLDAYLGFMVFYIWVAWRESSLTARIGWFVMIMCFGNMATCVYLILQLRRLSPDRSASDILSRQ